MSKCPGDLSPDELAEYSALSIALFRDLLAIGARFDISKSGLVGMLEGMKSFLLEDARTVPELIAKDRERSPV